MRAAGDGPDFIVPRGMDASQLEDCCDAKADSFGGVTADVVQVRFF